MADEKNPTPTPAPAGAPAWLVEVVDILEAIWAAMSASKSEPHHAVTEKLAALKAKLPKAETK